MEKLYSRKHFHIKTEVFRPYTARHVHQNLSTCLIKPLKTQSSAYCPSPTKRGEWWISNLSLAIAISFSLMELQLQALENNELNNHTSKWSRKRRARNLVSSRKKEEPERRIEHSWETRISLITRSKVNS